MSFLSVIKKIGQVVQLGAGIAQIATPMVAMTPIGPLWSTALNAITIAEQAFPASGAGPLKKDAVVAFVNQLHPGLDQAQLSIAVDSIVATLNALHQAQPDPTPPAVPPAPAK